MLAEKLEKNEEQSENPEKPDKPDGRDPWTGVSRSLQESVFGRLWEFSGLAGFFHFFWRFGFCLAFLGVFSAVSDLFWFVLAFVLAFASLDFFIFCVLINFCCVFFFFHVLDFFPNGPGELGPIF